MHTNQFLTSLFLIVFISNFAYGAPDNQSDTKNECSKDLSYDCSRPHHDVKFTHFTYTQGGDKTELVELATSLNDFLSVDPIDTTIPDSHGRRHNPFQLITPILEIINQVAPINPDGILDSLASSLGLDSDDNDKTYFAELKRSYMGLVKAQERSGAPLVPMAPSTLLMDAVSPAIQVGSKKLGEVYSEHAQEKMTELFASALENSKKLGLNNVYEFRKYVMEASLNSVNEYMSRLYDPKELVFKGLILGLHLPNGMFKKFEGIQKVIDNIQSKTGFTHVKFSTGVVLHSARRITTMPSTSSYTDKSIEVEKRKVFTLTPVGIFSGRLRPPTSDEGSSAKQVTSPLDTSYSTIGLIKAKREVDYTGLQSSEGVLLELNFVVYGITFTVNVTVFVKQLLFENPSDYFDVFSEQNRTGIAFTVSVENQGLLNFWRRRELQDKVGNFYVRPNAGIVKVYPMQSASFDVSTTPKKVTLDLHN